MTLSCRLMLGCEWGLPPRSDVLVITSFESSSPLMLLLMLLPRVSPILSHLGSPGKCTPWSSIVSPCELFPLGGAVTHLGLLPFLFAPGDVLPAPCLVPGMVARAQHCQPQSCSTHNARHTTTPSTQGCCLPRPNVPWALLCPLNPLHSPIAL